ncbi:O-antigen ligase family protein [Microbacterium sp. zg.Y909]|uniref:O-antigen ligase family protein n=1 Tax=Microbacterium sp. zg.Y909 TaxID=2969413 RepID=UPI00214B8022|nr:O-antigen ligase family protein [Microbacterium sp. zg.Y909]MCR2825899.1 O-antigen ligase family protein [Microbacterium sp. zg.Y909]
MTVAIMARTGPVAGRPATIRPLLAATVFVLLMAVTARGAIETVTGKQPAYAVQLICALLLVGVLRVRATPVPGRARRWGVYVALYALVAGGIASAIITVNTWHLGSIVAPALYIGTFSALGLLLCWGTDRTRTSDNLRVVAPAGVAVVVLQVAVGTGQQRLGWSFASGSDQASVEALVRPAGLTGSYLHYPLVLAVLAFMLFGVWMRGRSSLAILGSGVAVMGVLLSYSRSGMMILAFTLLFALLFSRTASTRLATVIVGLLAGAGTLLFLQGSPVLDRALSALDIESTGNVGRLAQWQAGVEMWTQSPLVLGSHTGLVTNITRNFGGLSIGVVESSVLQQLLNLGLVGAVATYWLLFAVVRAIPATDIWVRAGAAACLAQTAVYQSIEVLPFMTLLAVLPLAFTSAPVTAQQLGRTR